MQILNSGTFGSARFSYQVKMRSSQNVFSKIFIFLGYCANNLGII